MQQDVPPPYQAAPPNYQAAPQNYPPQEATVIIRPRPIFGRQPVQLTCSNCQRMVQTTVVATNGLCTWLAVLIIFLVFFPLFWVPLVVDSCKDFRHYCPGCHIVLGFGR